MTMTETSPSRAYEAIAPSDAAARRDTLLAKMAADRTLLRLNLARDDAHRPLVSRRMRPRLSSSARPDALTSSESEFEPSPAGPGQFMSDHALSVTAAVLGLLVLGPRQAVFAVLRNLAPLLLARGIRTWLDQADRSSADSGESADRRLSVRSSIRLGAAGGPDSADTLHAVSETSNEAPEGRRADAARFAAATNFKRNAY